MVKKPTDCGVIPLGVEQNQSGWLLNPGCWVRLPKLASEGVTNDMLMLYEVAPRRPPKMVESSLYWTTLSRPGTLWY